MNCKPGQMAMIVRGCRSHACVNEKIGQPVQVVELVGGFAALAIELLLGEEVGTVWKLSQPLSCPRQPQCLHGVSVVPDRCLKPFPDGEESKADETVVQKPVVAT